MSQPREALLPDVNLSDATIAGHADVVAMRHELHRMPEIGLEEYKTADYIEEQLKKLNIDHQRITATGIAGLIEGGSTMPILAKPANESGLKAVVKMACPRASGMSSATCTPGAKAATPSA